jgi:hypothetical protein
MFSGIGMGNRARISGWGYSKITYRFSLDLRKPCCIGVG